MFHVKHGVKIKKRFTLNKPGQKGANIVRVFISSCFARHEKETRKKRDSGALKIGVSLSLLHFSSDISI